MGSTIKNQVATCIAELKRGTLTEKSLRRIAEIADEVRAIQDILYLHTAANSPISEVLAMRIVESGEISD
jgi:hypothetical protein